MYAGRGYQASELGDVDVIKHNNEYHLFHLVLPNHDYIAHAVSKDGFVWRRVQNALFIGNPGSWDDDMLWTMHVTPDPDHPDQWRMFYTGLSRRENGLIQRIGVARSTDLYNWEKDCSKNYPLAVSSDFYEKKLNEGRNWVSFRDPYFYREDGCRFLIANARVATGPVIRRGCVALLKETEPDKFEFCPPLFFPHMYDDIEVPGLYKINDLYYLIGSLREDIKVHYWYSDDIFGNYRAFYDNLLLPQGNYAARILKESEEEYLVWNFFMNSDDEERKRLLPPPKRLVINDDGRLLLASSGVFDSRVKEYYTYNHLVPVETLLNNATARFKLFHSAFTIETECGYEIFLLQKSFLNFRLRFSAIMEGRGKFGIAFRLDECGSGYFISLDMINGVAQIRSWGSNDGQMMDKATHYKNIQINSFQPNPGRAYNLETIVIGGYIEFSINKQVILSLIDTLYMNDRRIGFYVESACMRIKNLSLEELDGPHDEEYGPV